MGNIKPIKRGKTEVYVAKDVFELCDILDCYWSGCEVKMTKQDIIEMIHRAGFDPVGRDTV